MSNCLLFVDMLGVKARWVANGREGAETAFRKLGDLSAVAVTSEPANGILAAYSESDSFCTEVDSLDRALRIAERMYRSAFEKDFEDPNRRTWLRGVIVPSAGGEHRTSTTPLAHLPAFRRFSYSAPVLEAINIEKSGFRGMRLLVEKTLVDDATKKRHMTRFDSLSLGKIVKLKHCVYPKRTEDYFDYLWFAPSSIHQWEEYETTMATRLRFASGRDEEFVQAAATQVAFSEVRAILADQRKKRAAGLSSRTRPHYTFQQCG